MDAVPVNTQARILLGSTQDETPQGYESSPLPIKVRDEHADEFGPETCCLPLGYGRECCFRSIFRVEGPTCASVGHEGTTPGHGDP